MPPRSRLVWRMHGRFPRPVLELASDVCSMRALHEYSQQSCNYANERRRVLFVSRLNAKWILLFSTVLFATAAGAQQAPSHLETPKVERTWSGQCDGHHRLGVAVLLDRKVLYRGVLPICRGSRETEDGRARFHFVGGHVFRGGYSTYSADSIEGDIWQACREPDALILGISFDTKKQILLNTLHIARPDKQTLTELDKGLFITTHPLPVR